MWLFRVDDNTDRFKVFARALLNGEVFPHLKALIPHLNASPAMVTKGWAQERVVALIGVLARENVCTKADMSDKLRTDTNWLLQVYALWVKKPAQDELVKIWGDLLDYDAGLVYAENDQAEAPSRRGRMQSSSDDDSASD
ncbi:hypothetical protein SARC_06710 [Sphaeroforma arctica JP610]|uniref:ATP-dependent RNA helicase DHX37-like C-terminal domain-containing protein n=1 Tax=Sphaeroforma arctica JP610 TaxID=667725 RepID=A0A0L0FVR8_9EUKA|nr:hypothetical protein SARC_06710 [Sphaeroforma arctica JP610]KNC80945.1 hypothetical protein SARC_06710 [Sphaeroforma arctica JP610]|eukprot:XP_014154847.1 hypothetical protein SARC_06710 [Sphaeroforma arctica JP610]